MVESIVNLRLGTHRFQMCVPSDTVSLLETQSFVSSSKMEKEHMATEKGGISDTPVYIK
jgi:hypothetical protein